MSTQNDELEELKSLTRHQLASIVWPVRTPKDHASYLNEFAVHIRNKFNEPFPNKYARELNEFSNLRNIALSTLSESSLRDNNSLKALKKYYCQLVSMLTRFKDCGAEFSWKDSFGRGSTDGNLEFELNNIMYDIAAIHNEIGAKIPKNTENSTKDACLHFSNALWWVTELRDNRTGTKPKEMGLDLLTFFRHVLRAQAQECVLMHSMRTGMKPENVAKISAHVANDYDVSTKLAQAPLYTDPIKEILNGATIFQNWRATVEFKKNYFTAMTQLLAGMAFKDDNAKEIGTRIARLTSAREFLEKGKKLIPDTLDSQTSRAAFDALDQLLVGKRDKAIRYNDNVYHATIPNRDTLPQTEGLSLISAAPFSISSIPEFNDLFSNLVTIESVQVNSIYSQKKDDLARQMKTQVEKQDDELAQMMSTLNIDKHSLRLPSFEASEELIEICAELSMNPTIVDDVLTKLEELDDKAEEVQNLLQSAQEMLKKRPNRQFEDELKRYRQTHEEALRTTQSLHKQLYPELQQKIQLLATTNDPLELLPKPDSSSAEDEELIRKLEKLLDKVDEMKQQRASLLSQLSQSLEKDDVIKYVVAAASEQELKNVFDKEIQKHHKYLAPLQSNLKLQNEILDTLERANAQYGQVKLNHRALRSAYKEKVESLKKIYAQFKATSDGIDQGLEYQKKMLELVRKFHQKLQATNDLNDLLN